MLAKRCGVIIDKGIMSKNPKIVFEHEIPVLQFKFGEGAIERVKIPQMVHSAMGKNNVQQGFVRFPIEEIDHDEEYQRMLNMYGKHEEEDRFVVQMAYGYQQETKLERLGELKYRPLLIAGHGFKPLPAPVLVPFDDGLGEIFDEVPADKVDMVRKEMGGEPVSVGNIDEEDFISQAELDASLPAHSESPVVTENQAEEASAIGKKPTIADIDTMYEIEHMTVPGIKAMLTERGIEFNPDDPKVILHGLFMNSMGAVGVDMAEKD